MASTNISMLERTARNKESDECYTPVNGIIPILGYLDKSLVWYEPTSKKSSSIVDTLNNNGYTCKGSLYDDFISSPIPNEIGGIITNPPYSIKDKFLQKCYESGLPFALLLPVSALQGKKRCSLYKEYGLEILVLPDRIDFTGKGQPHFGVAWFCNKILEKQIIIA